MYCVIAYEIKMWIVECKAHRKIFNATLRRMIKVNSQSQNRNVRPVQLYYNTMYNNIEEHNAIIIQRQDQDL